MKPIRAAVYVRISQDREGGGLGVQRQHEDCKRLAGQLGWEVVDLYADNDTSAYSGRKRENYERMLADIRSGRINGVLAWHTDRLHRNNRELLDYIDLSVERKLPTHTVTAGPLDLSTANGRAAAITLGAWARAESEHKAERIQRAHEQAAQQGRWRGGTRPFGYQSDGLALHPTEAPLLQDAYAAVRSGNSLASVMKAWNDAGVTTTTGKAWSYATLRQLLLRPRNYGASVHRGQVVATGQWEPVVDEVTWRAVAAILRAPGRRTSGSNQGRWLLPGLAFCGVCDDGETTVRTATGRSRGKSHTIYKCRAASHLGRRAEYVDEYVRDTVLLRLARDDARDLLTPADSDDADLSADADGIRLRIQEAEGLWSEGLLSTSKYRATVTDLQGALAELEARMGEYTSAPILAELIEADDPRQAWEELSWTQQRVVVDTLCAVTIMPTGRGKARTFDRSTVRIVPNNL